MSELRKVSVLADVARRRLLWGQPGSVVAADLGLRDEAEVATKLAEAKRTEVAVTNINQQFGLLGVPDPAKAAELRQTFELAAKCLVIKVDQEDLNRPDLLAVDDYLHLVLANQTGRQLLAQLKHGYHFAVGPGRPVNHVAHYLVRSTPAEPEDWEEVRVIPLAGRWGAHPWVISGPRYARNLDADDAVFSLSLALEGQKGVEFSLIGHSLFAESADAARQILDRDCEFRSDGSWRDRAPDLGIVGIGAADAHSGHRLAALFNDAPDPWATKYLNEAAVRELTETLMLAPQLGGVSDIVNRHYAALPMPDKLRALNAKEFVALAAAYDQLLARLSSLNQRAIAAKWGHLRQIHRLTAVAGGKFKLQSLWTLLLAGFPSNPDEHVIKALNTDYATAEALLRAKLHWRALDGERQAWCSEVARRMFTDCAAPKASTVPSGLPKALGKP